MKTNKRNDAEPNNSRDEQLAARANKAYDEGRRVGKQDAVQEVTNLINGAIDNTIATSPIARTLKELRDKIQREVY